MVSIDSLIESSALQYVEFDFPSRGMVYLDCPSSVLIRPTITEEEKYLKTIIKNDPQLESKMGKYIEAITNLKELGLSAYDLTTGDQLSLLLYSRILSNGVRLYPTKIVCPNCESNETVDVDILGLTIEYLPKDYSDPGELELKEHNLVLGLRLLRVNDKVELRQWHKEIKKAGVKLENISDDIEGLYARSIVSVKKNDEETNLVFSQKRALLSKMPTPAMNKIVDWHSDHYHGYLFETPFVCSSCGYESEDPLAFELGADFFYLKPTKKESRNTEE